MSTYRDDDFTAFIGLDWADAKHDFCLQPHGSEAREFGMFAHQPEAIEAWARALHQRFGGRIAIALELAKGPVVYALQKYDFFVLFPGEISVGISATQDFVKSLFTPWLCPTRSHNLLHEDVDRLRRNLQTVQLTIAQLED